MKLRPHHLLLIALSACNRDHGATMSTGTTGDSMSSAASTASGSASTGEETSGSTTEDAETSSSTPSSSTGPQPCTGPGCACTDACDDGLECAPEGLCAPDGMVWVPEGEFMRGCTLENEPHCDLADEGPYSAIFVSGYAIDRTEVTEAAFEQCVQAGACVAPLGPQCTKGIGEKPYDPVNNGDWPVDCVPWDQASAYCAWAGKRLPTEAEWEKAARGIDGRRFPWGDSPEPTCEYIIMAENNMNGCGLGDRWAVGSKPLGASPYGVMDMIGNVSEWVSDWHALYDPEMTVDPMGPASGTNRARRGGTFHTTSAGSARTTFRSLGPPEIMLHGFGFRCAWSE